MNKAIPSRLPIFILAMVLLLAGLLPGCIETDPVRYALLMSHLTNSFTITLATSAREEAERLGVDLVVLDAQQSADRQSGQIQTLLQDGIDGIILEPVSSDGLTDALESCQAVDVPVVIVAQQIQSTQLFDCFVGTDAVETGRLEMATCLEAIGYSGDIVILHGPNEAQAQIDRYTGYREILAAWPSVRIIAEQSADWNDRKAYDTISGWIASGKRFDAIVAQNDDMAIGALDALRSTGLEKRVKVFGVDASPPALASIRSGEMTATVSQQSGEQGLQAMRACFKLVNGQSVEQNILIEQLVIQAS